MILPSLLKDRKEKRGIITSLISGFIALAYEGISSFLYNRRHKALQKAVVEMENKINLQHNKLIHLEDSMVMYGVYNAETIEKLITTIHKMHNFTTWNERLFAGKLGSSSTWYLTKNGVHHYAINTLLYLRTLREIYVKMYEEFIIQLWMYAKVIRTLSKGYLSIPPIPSSKLQEILHTVKTVIQTTNPDYDSAIERLHLYYDMKLVTLALTEIEIW